MGEIGVVLGTLSAYSSIAATLSDYKPLIVDLFPNGQGSWTSVGINIKGGLASQTIEVKGM